MCYWFKLSPENIPLQWENDRSASLNLAWLIVTTPSRIHAVHTAVIENNKSAQYRVHKVSRTTTFKGLERNGTKGIYFKHVQ